MAKKKPKLDFTDELAKADDSEISLNIPIHVFIAEAADIGHKCVDYYVTQSEGDVIVRPGLSRAGKKLPPGIGAEVIELAHQALIADGAIRLALKAKVGTNDVDRALYLVGELDAVLWWCFEDGIYDDKDAQLEGVRTRHAKTGGSIAALIAKLSDYQQLAQKYRGELATVEDFELALIDEAAELVKTLLARPDGSLAQPSPEIAAAMVNRNKLINLLIKRVNIIRAAAQYVYRNDPVTLRKFGSMYERRRRSTSSKKVEPVVKETVDA